MKPLAKMGILGINRRNVALINRYNPRSAFPLVDDKIKTKELQKTAQIPMPRVYGVARSHFELRSLGRQLDELESFVMKPARGAMGNGIVVISGRTDQGFVKASGKTISRRKLLHHASSILSGLYALGAQEDRVLVEEKLNVHESLERLSHRGVPDVRVILYRGFPVMAMMRLPTRRSDGRANLHQGAVGVGLEVGTGRGIAAIQDNRSVKRHPDTGHDLLGFRVPQFDAMLAISVAAADQTGLGYLGVDIVIDQARGPMVLELNARPGLSVQICNQTGLLPRLADVDQVVEAGLGPSDRIEWSQKKANQWRRSWGW